jgi:ABC-type multidrug transport system permease subunit
MHPIFVLLRKDFLLFRRDRGRVILTFLVPLVMIYLFGHVFGVNRRDPGPNAIALAVVAEAGNADAAKLVAALRAETAFHLHTTIGGGKEPKRRMTESDVRPLIREGQFRFAVVIPANFPGRELSPAVHLKLLGNGRNAVETQTVAGLVQKALFAEMLSPLVKIDEEKVTVPEARSPMATQLVGGWAMQFLLFALVASATSLFEERDRGLFQRILSGPIPPSAILWSKFLFGICLGLFQLTILFVAGRLLFGIEILSHFPRLLLVCVCAAAVCSAFGMLLASLAKTSGTAQGLSAFSILLMSALGGAWFPVNFMPEFMQQLSRFTLVHWSITGFRQVLWQHAPLEELFPTLGILVGATVALLSVAWWRFNRGRIFD